MELLGRKVKYETCSQSGEGIAVAKQGSGFIVIVESSAFIFNENVMVDEVCPEVEKYYGQHYRYAHHSSITKYYNEEKGTWEKVSA